jgi:predicted HicB family RNase H-like nuclease
MMIYKGYEAIVEFDNEANILHGEILHLNDVITFQADCVAGLERSFHDSVDEYLEFCAAQGRQPEKPYSGKVALRLPPDLHREITAAARQKRESVNNYIVEALESYSEK